jgi:fatty acid desaturase
MSAITTDVRPLAHRHLTPWLRAAASDWAIVLSSLTAVAMVPWLTPAAVLIIGTRQHSLALLGHDATHHLACRGPWNDALANLLVFWPFGVDLARYRVWHLAHHVTFDTWADPEVPMLRRAFWHGHDFTRRWVSIVVLRDLLLLGGAPEVVRFLREVGARTPAEFVGPAAWWAAAITLSFAVGTPWLPAVWAIALFSSFWTVFTLRIWTEHAGRPSGTRRVRRPTLLERATFLPRNTWCHWEHHVWPYLPFHNLPAARAVLGVVATPLVSPLPDWGTAYKKK